MRKKSKNTKMLEKFMLEDDMKCCFNSIVNTTTFSYESKINGDRSLLDHFLGSDNTFYAITEYTSLHHGQNLSDHNAIRLVLDIDVNYVVLSDLDSVRAQSCDWAKATENQLELYKQQLNSQLSSIMSIVLPVEARHCCDTNCSKHNQSLQAYHDAIISCCITSGTESIPLKGGGSKSSKSDPGRVPGWTEHVEQSKQRAIFWHWLWKAGEGKRLTTSWARGPDT